MPKRVPLHRLKYDRDQCAAALREYELGRIPDLGRDDPSNVMASLRARISELDALIEERDVA